MRFKITIENDLSETISECNVLIVDDDKITDNVYDLADIVYARSELNEMRVNAFEYEDHLKFALRKECEKRENFTRLINRKREFAHCLAAI